MELRGFEVPGGDSQETENMKQLIETSQSLSPMEIWREKHNVLTYAFEGEIVANVDGEPVKGKGQTREEALMDWAIKRGVPCWKSEAMEGGVK